MAIALAAVCIFANSNVAYAQEADNEAEEGGFGVDLGTDIMSAYVWRGGLTESGASIAPWMDLTFGNFTLEAWGLASISHVEVKEVDWYLTYEKDAFKATLSDYFWAGERADYSEVKQDHHFELGVAYTFGEKAPVTVEWNTMIAGGEADELDDEDKRMFSSYANVSCNIDVKGVTLTPAIGITPWKSMYSDQFDVLDVTLKAAKEIKLSESFSLPISTQFVWSPAYDKAYFTVAVSF